MSREAKFRVWDKKNKSWLKLDHNPMISHEGKIIWFSHQGLEQLPKDDYEETWFTGRKDKNGKEIYEGDIFSPGWVPGEVFVVIYDEKTSRFCELRRGSVRANKVNIIMDGSFLISEHKKPEIIGNIYENGDLLNGKD